MRILHLTLKKKWFDEIDAGWKTIEYREIKPYWTKRLHEMDDGCLVPKVFDEIHFRLGYAKDAKTMRFKWGGLGFSNVSPLGPETCYAIYLGERR